MKTDESKKPNAWHLAESISLNTYIGSVPVLYHVERPMKPIVIGETTSNYKFP